ncbi:MAG: hypothetical protein OEU95_08030 [Nitrospirota bacterium]|nr:hypothetical protein [Nitrospirota bacterium]
MGIRNFALHISILMIVLAAGCTQQYEVAEMRHFPLDSMEGVITRSGVELDREISSDGKGSLRVTALEPTVVRLFEVSDPGIDNATLTYKAKVRTKDMDGVVYLEMWCGFRGKGEFFSRNVQTPLTGTMDWTTEETLFFLYRGERPEYIKLNLVVNGKGTAWIDDIHLLKGPPK